jgi:hypothetical protein
VDRTTLASLSRFWLLFALLPAACVGHIGDGSERAEEGERAGGPGSAALDAAPARLHHLTARQYVNTVRALLGTKDANPVLVDDEDDVPSMLLIEKLNVAAEALVSLHAHDKFVTCTDSDECAKKYIETFGERAFRRPLTDEESTWLFSVFTTARATNTFAESIDQLTLVILQSPQLFYFAEEGLAESSLPGGLRRLSGFERASRLSYLLWDSMPDAALFAAARSGALDTKEGVAAEARRMLDDDRARATLRSFLLDDWLGLSGSQTHVGIADMVKDRAVFPDDSPALRAGMRADVERLVDKVYADGGSLKALLTTNDAYVNAPLAKVYGVSGGPAGPDSAWVKLDPAQRAGLLTRSAFLAVYSNPTVKSPIRRGAQLVKGVLCLDIGEPPPNVNNVPIPAESEAGVHRTVRETVSLKTKSSECAGCHSIINPAGFSFEHYDGLGLWEQLERGTDPDGKAWSLAIDWTGELRGTDVMGTFNGAIELSQRLAESRTLKDCLVSRWFTKTFARATTPTELPSVQEAQAHFAKSDDLKELVLGVVQSPAFLYVRSPLL